MDKLDFALQVLVLGFMVVMVTLFGLYGVLILFNKYFYHDDKKPPLKAETGRVDRVTTDTAADSRVIAAIMAAVYQYVKSDRAYTGAPLKIAIQPTAGAALNSWRNAGRKKLLESRMELEKVRRNNRRENI